jgi:outer membrane protein OmpA-like peptidoglycan-associated protein
MLPAPAQAAWHGGGGGGGAHGWSGGGGWHGGGWQGGHGWWGGRGWWGGVGFGYWGGYPGWYGYAPYYAGYYPGYAYYPGYPAYPATYAYPGYAQPPAPPPAPARAPAAQHAYNVFFDFDRSELNPVAARIVQQAADSARNTGVTRIYVDGHTDSTGTGGYNQALSQRRAEAVRRQLIADGIPAGEIVTNASGKSGQLVPTADQVREPQNRRVEIVLGDAQTSALEPPAGQPQTQLATANCRDFQRSAEPGGQSPAANGTACLQADGSWRIVR